MFMDFIGEIIYFFNESAIYILFGFLVAGVLKIALPTEKVLKYLGKKENKISSPCFVAGNPDSSLFMRSFAYSNVIEKTGGK